MTVLNCNFYQLQLLKQWLRQSQDLKQDLFLRLASAATDPATFDRLRWDLQYFIEIEKNVAMKILNFDSSDPSDFVLNLDINAFR